MAKANSICLSGKGRSVRAGVGLHMSDLGRHRPRHANAPIVVLRCHPSNTQAGGHPTSRSTFDGRKPGPPAQPEPLQLRGRERRDRPPPARLHRQPARDAAVHGRRLLRRRMPDRLAGRDRRTSIATQRHRLRLAPSTTSSRRPTTPGLLGFKIFLFDTPQFTVPQRPHRRRLRPRRRPRPRSSTALFPLRDASGRTSGASRPTRATTRCGSTRATPSGAIAVLLRRRSATRTEPTAPTDPNTIVKPCSTNSGLPPVASNSPLTPFLQNPTTCDTRSTRRSTSSPTTAAPTSAEDGLAADDRLRPAQLQPEPLRAADDDARPTPPRASTSTSRSRSS